MIKFKKNDTDNILIRVKGISAHVKELLSLLDMHDLSIDELYKYKKLEQYVDNTIVMADIRNLLCNGANDLINISHIKIMYDITEVKCIKFDTFYFFKALLSDASTSTYFLTNDKMFIEKYIKKNKICSTTTQLLLI